MAKAIRSKSRTRRKKKRNVREQTKCRFGGDASKIDYKDIATLSKFVTSQGKVFSRKRSGCSAKCQRALIQAIKRARYMGLMPYTG